MSLLKRRINKLLSAIKLQTPIFLHKIKHCKVSGKYTIPSFMPDFSLMECFILHAIMALLIVPKARGLQ